MDRPPEKLTHYRLLEIAENATQEEVDKAYKKKASEYHPEQFLKKNQPLKVDDATYVFQALRNAYEVLSDKEKRREYDRSLENMRKENTHNVASKSSPTLDRKGPQENLRKDKPQNIISKSTNITLFSLPQDVHNLIHRYLDLKDLYRLSNVSKTARSFIKWDKTKLKTREAYVKQKHKEFIEYKIPLILHKGKLISDFLNQGKYIQIGFSGDDKLKTKLFHHYNMNFGPDHYTFKSNNYNLRIFSQISSELYKKYSTASLRSLAAIVILADNQKDLEQYFSKIPDEYKKEIFIFVIYTNNSVLNTSSYEIDGIMKIDFATLTDFSETENISTREKIALFILECFKKYYDLYNKSIEKNMSCRIN